MEANGRACYRGSNTPAPGKPGPAALDKSTGHCFSPLVENRPKGLSATYCQCSVGYMKESFRVLAGKEPKVELLESVLRGGKECRFRIEV